MRRRQKGQSRSSNFMQPRAVWERDPLELIRPELNEMERKEREERANSIPTIKVLTKEEARAMALKELARRY